MKGKLVAAFILLGFGLVGGFVTYSGYMGDDSASVSPVYTLGFGLAVVCLVVGSVLAFTQLLDNVVRPVTTELEDDLADDFEELKSGNLTATWWMFIITSICTIVFGFLVIRFHKFEAMWGIVPVAIVAVVSAAAIIVGTSFTEWFTEPDERTPFWVFLIPSIGLVLALVLGISNTEDVKRLDVTQQSSGYTYVYTPHYYFFGNSSSGSSSSFDMPKCTGKNCGYAYLLMFLIVLVVILVVGSAFITHFWFVAGTIMVAILIMMTVREFRVRERRYRSWR